MQLLPFTLVLSNLILSLFIGIQYPFCLKQLYGAEINFFRALDINVQ